MRTTNQVMIVHQGFFDKDKRILAVAVGSK